MCGSCPGHVKTQCVQATPGATLYEQDADHPLGDLHRALDGV